MSKRLDMTKDEVEPLDESYLLNPILPTSTEGTTRYTSISSSTIQRNTNSNMVAVHKDKNYLEEETAGSEVDVASKARLFEEGEEDPSDRGERNLNEQKMLMSKDFIKAIADMIRQQDNEATKAYHDTSSRSEQQTRQGKQLLPNKIHKLPMFKGKYNFLEWRNKVKVLAAKFGWSNYLLNDPEDIEWEDEGQQSMTWKNLTSSDKDKMMHLYYEMYESIGNSYKHLVENITVGDVPALWTQVHEQYEPKGNKAMCHALHMYDNTRLERRGDIVKYTAAMNKHYTRIKALGGEINSTVRIAKYLNGLPDEDYGVKKTILAERECTYTELQSIMISYYHQHIQSTKEIAMFMKTKPVKNKWKSKQKTSKSQGKDKSKYKGRPCNNCGKEGHWYSECKKAKKSKDKEKVTTLIAAVKETALFTGTEETESNWVYDTGCSRHMCNDLKYFVPETLRPMSGIKVVTGKGTLLPTMVGTAKPTKDPVFLEETLYVPGIYRNLISGPQLDIKGVKATVENGKVKMFFKRKKVLQAILTENNLYEVEKSNTDLKEEICLSSEAEKNSEIGNPKGIPNFQQVPLDPRKYQAKTREKQGKESGKTTKKNGFSSKPSTHKSTEFAQIAQVFEGKPKNESDNRSNAKICKIQKPVLKSKIKTTFKIFKARKTEFFADDKGVLFDVAKSDPTNFTLKKRNRNNNHYCGKRGHDFKGGKNAITDFSITNIKNRHVDPSSKQTNRSSKGLKMKKFEQFCKREKAAKHKNSKFFKNLKNSKNVANRKNFKEFPPKNCTSKRFVKKNVVGRENTAKIFLCDNGCEVSCQENCRNDQNDRS